MDDIKIVNLPFDFNKGQELELCDSKKILYIAKPKDVHIVSNCGNERFVNNTTFLSCTDKNQKLVLKYLGVFDNRRTWYISSRDNKQLSFFDPNYGSLLF